jgi:hypothetical protein
MEAWRSIWALVAVGLKVSLFAPFLLFVADVGEGFFGVGSVVGLGVGERIEGEEEGDEEGEVLRSQGGNLKLAEHAYLLSLKLSSRAKLQGLARLCRQPKNPT